MIKDERVLEKEREQERVQEKQIKRAADLEKETDELMKERRREREREMERQREEIRELEREGEKDRARRREIIAVELQNAAATAEEPLSTSKRAEEEKQKNRWLEVDILESQLATQFDM